jgi:hypothetical protein
MEIPHLLDILLPHQSNHLIDRAFTLEAIVIHDYKTPNPNVTSRHKTGVKCLMAGMKYTDT